MRRKRFGRFHKPEDDRAEDCDDKLGQDEEDVMYTQDHYIYELDQRWPFLSGVEKSLDGMRRDSPPALSAVPFVPFIS